MVPLVLEGLAGVAINHGQGDRAARLLGAADAERLARGTPVMPINRPLYERTVTAVRDTLGDEAFTHAREEGQAMSLEQAVAYALEELGPSGES